MVLANLAKPSGQTALCELAESGARSKDCNAGCFYLSGRADLTETKVV